MATASYPETVNWLFSLQKFGIKLGLQSITRLLELLGNPHHDLRCIHIAGTNGKGSTAAFLHAIYCRAGFRPGLYTSPHLIDFTERIVIGGMPIAPQEVTALVSRLRALCRRNNLDHITFFEFTTALALTYFAEKKADPIVLETGLGGRLDATNVVNPLLSIITSINLEHTAHLGPTLMHIAREKAGIIKPGKPCISSVTRSGPRACIRSACSANGSQILEYGRDFSMRRYGNGYRYQGPECRLTGLKPGLAGRHQARNASLAVTAAVQLRTQGLFCSDTHLHEGLSACFWPGRLETVLYKDRRFVLDGAHNPAAWRVLVRALKVEYTYRRLVFIIGVMRDKDIGFLCSVIAHAHCCIFFKPRMERAAGRDCIEKYAVFSARKKVLWVENIAQSLTAAITHSGSGDLICITGSLFAVGEARELLCNPMSVRGRRIGL